MFSFKNRILKFKQKRDQKRLLLKAESLLQGLNIEVDTTDVDDSALLFMLDDNTTSLLVVDPGVVGHRIETNVAFDVDIANLKTVSDICGIVFANRCSMTELKGVGTDKVQVGVCCHIGTQLTKSNLESAVLYVQQCIQMLTDLLIQKLERASNPILDISMFEGLDISFNPRILGEKKDFLYKDWESFAKAVIKDEDGLVDAELPEIIACRDFEKANEVPLSEVGDMVFKELIWHRKILSSLGEYSIN